MRQRIRRLVAGTVTTVLSTGAIATVPATTAHAATSSVVIDFAGATPTPAPGVPGATTGGRLTWLQEYAPAHFDPQQIYDIIDVSTQLFHRTLTGYLEDPGGGPMRLVGDLATNAGVTSDGGRTWTYHLRPDLKFDDGTAITSSDIAYGIARSFSEQGLYGPHYLQLALDPSGTYSGPYGGQELPPRVSTPDAATIVFTFAQPHPEFPYLAAFPTTTPVPKGKDTRENYDRTWLASGPYQRIAEEPGVSLTLGRNPHWDPASDPIRHQYADTIHFDWTADRATQTQRVIAAAGDDAGAVMTANVAADQIANVQASPALMARVLAGATPLVKYININTERVPDVSIRRALNYAFSRAELIAAQGGSAVAAPATTILAPTVPGHLAYDAYPTNVSKAKRLLQGRKPSLSYCFPSTPDDEFQAGVIKAGLQAAGFRITLAPLDATSYWGLVGSRANTCDLIYSAWVADFPDGDATLRVLLDGNLIRDEGNINFSLFDDACVNEELEYLATLTDRTAAATRYGALDREIMREHAPLIPTVHSKSFLLHGPAVGGTFLSGLTGRPNLANAYRRG
ncbi:ABC transporter substrate-binding protein [Catelliglobosispora koreensis]|uniref:ABC transporter substrate-binding protein n=1 Tax=Catelliglobosispora koreensis TaxID=129052 RepID=UPI00037CDE7A|nr:ABC transporter substrate-binding protein [Catelliglobosispora koreensis]